MERELRQISRDNGSHKGKVKILITNFHRQSSVQVDDIVKSLDNIPNRHLEGLVEILYDPEREFQKNIFGWIPKRKRLIVAEYAGDLRTIIIYPFADKAVFFHALLHELGHFVYQQRIDSFIRKHWVTHVFRKDRAVTSYAALNAAEGFAESYAIYVNDPVYLQNSFEQEYQFMQKTVFLDYETSGQGSMLDILV